MKKEKYRYLFGNMALFTVSNFVSKLLVMLLVPFYTNVLTTSEYGVADIMQATLLLLVPLLTVNIGEAALRYGLEKNSRKDLILKISIKYAGIADAVVFLVCGLLALLLKNPTARLYCVFFFGLFLCDSIYEVMILFCQGCEQVKIMIIGSVSCTILVIASNLYFLLILKIGLWGYLISQMISFLGAAFLMFFLIMRKRKQVLLSSSQMSVQELEIEMRQYGSSMLLYSTSSWINNAIDRYFVLGMCGASANGLYGVAYKIPAILSVFQRIFAQAWQMSATKNYKDKDRVSFFKTMYRGYQMIMVIGCSFLILIVELIARFLFAKAFFVAWKMVPPLLISVIFGALTGFLGSICLAYKDGKSMGRATTAGAIVNIVLNTVGIYLIGVLGAAVATMISYFVMYCYAYQKVQKHIDFQMDRRKDFLAYGLLLVEAAVCMYMGNIKYVINTGIFILLIVLYGLELLQIRKENQKYEP